MKLGNFEIGKKAFIIAEIGTNHNGDFETAKRLVEAAAKTGCDAVKFQIWNSDKKIIRSMPAIPRLRPKYKTQYERFKSLELSREQYHELAETTRSHGVEFFATVFDEDSLNMIKKIVSFYKIASGEITNIPLLRMIAKEKKPVMVSVGAADTSEIDRVFTEIPKGRVVLLHCIAAYPAPYEEANLRAIPFLAERYDVPVGYSDHVVGTIACLAAVALGACVIEKHFTLDKTQPLGDHKHSAEPDEMKKMVEDIRAIEKMLGRKDKPIARSEEIMRTLWRRGLYANTDISKGAVLKKDMIIPLRPLDGTPAERIDFIIGKKTKRDIKYRQPIYEKDLA